MFKKLFLMFLFVILNVSVFILITCTPGAIEEKEEILTDIKGTVLSTKDMLPVSGCEVAVGKSKAVTDSSGNYHMTVKDLKTKKITAKKSGFVTGSKIFNGMNSSMIVFDIYIIPVEYQKEIDPALDGGNVITAPSGASVTIPKLTGITENLIIKITNLDVATEEIKAAPGDFTGTQTGGGDAVIWSEGMVNVDITGKTSGKSYSLNGLGNFDIKIPITGDINNAPATIPKWYYDTNSGKWIEEGILIKSADGKFYESQVTHFSFWNADFKMPNRTCISGKLNDPDGAAGDIYTVHLYFTGFDNNYSTTDKDFTIINLPPNTDMTIEITNERTKVVSSLSFTTGSGQSCYDLGNFFDGSNQLEVQKLTYTKEIDSITFNWEKEPADIKSVEISYYNIEDASPTILTVLVPSGTLTATISGLDAGRYSFTIKCIYTDDTKSNGRKVVTKIDSMFLLEIYTGEWSVDVYYYLNGSSTRLLYTGPVMLPVNTEVKLEITEDIYNYFYWAGIDLVDPDFFNIAYLRIDEDRYVTVYFDNPS